MSLIRPGEVINTGIARATPLSARFDAQLVAPHIEVAEIRYIRPVLGDALFNAMAAAQFAGDSNYNPAFALQNKFVDGNFEALWFPNLLILCARAVAVVALPSISIQVSAGGVFRNSGEFGEAAGTKEIKFLIDSWTQDIYAMQQQILGFLCENKDNYPLFDWQKNCGNCGVSPAKSRNFGLIFD